MVEFKKCKWCGEAGDLSDLLDHVVEEHPDEVKDLVLDAALVVDIADPCVKLFAEVFTANYPNGDDLPNDALVDILENRQEWDDEYDERNTRIVVNALKTALDAVIEQSRSGRR